MVDFYVHPRPEGSLPEHIGFSYVLPGNLREASGSCTVPITGNRHQPVGQLVGELLEPAVPDASRTSVHGGHSACASKAVSKC